MIKYNNSNINDWFYTSDNIIKVYRNNAVCYYKITTSGGTSGQTPCFAVVDDISQYSDTEFEDVFNKANGKWYKLNNLSQYEEYGIYGSGRNITYYNGKLTIDDGYEYIYSGGSWVNVGEVSGSTATLPNVPFVLNYNAKNYDATTHRIAMTTGQLNDTDAVAYNSPNNIVDHSADGYISISESSMQIRKTGQDISLFNRQSDSTHSDLTIVTKAKTTSNDGNIITNRDSDYNWMYRQYGDYLTFHGQGETGSISCSQSNPDIMSVRTYYDNGTKVKYNNWTQNTSTTPIDFYYGGINYDGSYAGALFVGYGWTNSNEQWSGDFYWVYMAQANLTDAQIQQVIDYNEGGSQTVYPMYYTVMQDPPNNLSFSSMTEAEEYECPYVGMKATIDGDKYIFSGDSQSGYEWVEQSGKTEDFTILDIGESALTSSLSDGDYVVISFKNYNNPREPQYMMSYKNDGTYDRVNNFSGHTGSNTITNNTIIDAAVWQLEGTATANTYYIKNVESGLYWGYQDTSTSYSFYLVDSSQKTPVLLDDYDGCIGLIEMGYPTVSYFGGYGLNQLYGYTYLLNWLNYGSGSEEDFYSYDGNALYVLYKLQ